MFVENTKIWLCCCMYCASRVHGWPLLCGAWPGGQFGGSKLLGRGCCWIGGTLRPGIGPGPGPGPIPGPMFGILDGPIIPPGGILFGTQFGPIPCVDGELKSGPNEQPAASDDIAESGTDGSVEKSHITHCFEF
jgi:hypothetical protein